MHIANDQIDGEQVVGQLGTYEGWLPMVYHGDLIADFGVAYTVTISDLNPMF